jgi:choline-sulfatase
MVRRFHSSWLAGFAALGFALSACSRGESGAAGKAAGYNVLLVTLDTTRADHLGCYGRASAQTPALDGLAARGVLWEHALSTAPLTTPAHASLLTGLYPPAHGVRNNGSAPLDAAHPTLAGLLRERGYATAAFVSAFVLDRRYGLDRGFEVYDDAIEPTTAAAAFGSRDSRSARAVTDAALGWLEERDPDRPFLLWVHYYDPHDPYQPPPPFDERFRDRPYDGEIAYVDSQLARLISALGARGLEPRTLVAVAGDHGESLGEHGEAAHARLVYEGAMRVPLILACPGVLGAGERVEDRVASIADLAPSLLELLGVEPPRICDGSSLFAPAEAGRAVYLETLLPYYNHGWAPLFALRTREAKYILAPRRELYDLVNDPAEAVNLYGRDPRSAELERELDERLRGWGPRALPQEETRVRDPEEVSKLAALGYSGSVSPDGSVGVLDPKDMIASWHAVLEAKRLAGESRGPTAAAKLDEAVRILEGVLERSPRDRSALQQLARVQLQRRRNDLAREALERYIAIQPSADACVFLAQLLIADGRVEEAEARLALAEALEPRHGGIFIARGELFARQRRWKEAEAAYETALEVDPARARGMATAGLEDARARLARER